MKKNLLTYSGRNFSQGVFHFIQQLNVRQPVQVTAIFLPERLYVDLYSDTGGIGLTSYLPLLDQEDEAVQETMKAFDAACRRQNIACRLYKNYATAPEAELLQQARFADALVVSSEKGYQTSIPGELNPSLQKILHSCECPVLIVPEEAPFPEKNILFYDGSASSVFAIKQFAYLFPELCTAETILVYARHNTAENIPHEAAIREWAAPYFTRLKFSTLHPAFEKDMATWASGKEGALLVSGSFGRSGFSELFHKSFTKDLIHLRRFPVFVAHR